jgi:hypothetical protein
VRRKLNTLFQLCLSGTHATPERRERWIRTFLLSAAAHDRLVGVGMLEAAIEARHWSASTTFEFGARPRDFGYLSNSIAEELSWFRRFLKIAEEGAQSEDTEVKRQCRHIVADQLRNLWRYPDLRSDLAKLSVKFNADDPWHEGWRATRMILRFDEKKSEGGNDEELRRLSEKLRPTGLISEISAHVINTGWDHLDDEFDTEDEEKWEKAHERARERARELGRQTATVREVISELDVSLFGGQGYVLRFFGEGLAEATEDKFQLWASLIDIWARRPQTQNDFGVLVGVIGIISRDNPADADRLLEEAMEQPELRPILFRLQEHACLDSHGIERLLRLIDCEDVDVWTFSSVGWGAGWDDVPEQNVAELLERLSRRKGGGKVAIDALGMRFHGDGRKGRSSSSELRRLSLRIVEGVLSDIDDKSAAHLDHHLTTVLKIAFLPEEHREECSAVVRALVDNVICSSRGTSDLDDAAALIAKRMPHELLTRLRYDSDLSGYRLNRAFKGRHNKPLLGDVAHTDLVAWCTESDAADRFLFAINAIEVFTASGDISNQAKALLQNTPDQKAALLAIAQSARPSSWSGNRSDILKARKQGIESLRTFEFLTARQALEEHIQRLEGDIASETESERNRDEDREQRFE